MGKANLHPDFREFFALLNKARIRYLLIGGYAVNYYGHHRYTKDIDVWVAIDPANREKLAQTLQEFGGFPAAAVQPHQFAEPGKVFAMGREPVRIDVLTGPSGVNFDACWERRIIAVLDGVQVPIISLRDLRANKQASGRLRDLADVENLPPAGKPVRKRLPRGR